MRQADDLDFALALNAIGSGEMNAKHIELMESRCFQSFDYLLKNKLITRNATVLSYTRKDMKANNEIILNNLTTPGTVNIAFDSIVGKLNYRSGKKLNKAFVLKKASELDESKTYGLAYSLFLKINARYMITSNIDTVDGLANGTTGYLKKITFSTNTNIQKVIIAWFDF